MIIHSIVLTHTGDIGTSVFSCLVSGWKWLEGDMKLVSVDNVHHQLSVLLKLNHHSPHKNENMDSDFVCIHPFQSS